MKKIIFFGNRLTGFDLHNNSNSLFKKREFFKDETVVCLKQIHSAAGVTITTKKQAQQVGIREVAGDFLVTNQPCITLVLLTADCLPLFLYDPVKHVVAAVHAGWRGSVAGIVNNAVMSMQQLLGSQVEKIQVFFGPCAKVCCYQVGTDFVLNVQDDSVAQQSLISKNGCYYFDNVQYNSLLLLNAGIQKNNLNYSDNSCTICRGDYCSVRKYPGSQERNVSFVTLK